MVKAVDPVLSDSARTRARVPSYQEGFITYVAQDMPFICGIFSTADRIHIIY